MNFSSDSVKLKSKAQNEQFFFDIETDRGHFFAVLDFGAHDYANLNATLKGKLETIIGTLISLSRFSADLFLGFLAKEINNFLHSLGEQSGGPELVCSAALCLVSGNQLSYFRCGDTRISILISGRPLPLHGAEADRTGEKPDSADQAGGELEQLGAHNQEAPMTNQVQALTLRDEDTVLIMTHGLEEAFDSQQLANEIESLRPSDPKIICDMLMKASASSRDDRTLVVISGPYERYLDAVLPDLSKTVASWVARSNALTDSNQLGDSVAGHLDKDLGSEIQPEQKFSQQIEMLKDDLRGKASKSDFVELDEKINNLNMVLSSKADTAEVLRLERKVLERLASLVELGNSSSASRKKPKAKRAKASNRRKTSSKGKSTRAATKTAAKKSGKANEGPAARASENKTALRAASSKKAKRRASIKRSKSR